MAEHGDVKVENEAHTTTYSRFMSMTKVSTVIIAILVLFVVFLIAP